MFISALAAAFGSKSAQQKQMEEDIEALVRDAKERGSIDEKVNIDVAAKRKRLHDWLRKHGKF